jgi:hypothetical protein
MAHAGLFHVCKTAAFPYSLFQLTDVFAGIEPNGALL